MAYDRRLGGWRGPVTHLDGGAALAQNWAGPLAQVTVPPGILPDWRLAVVLDETDSQARLGWLDPASQIGATPQQHTGVVSLSDVAWARQVKDGKPGPAPRRMAASSTPPTPDPPPSPDSPLALPAHLRHFRGPFSP